MVDQYSIRFINDPDGCFLHAGDVNRTLMDLSLEPSLTQEQVQILRNVANIIKFLATKEER